MKYTFSKGELELVDNRLVGWIKASTDFQHELPSRMDIDTTVDKLSPINISEVKQFRISMTWVVLLPIMMFVVSIVAIVIGIIAGGGYLTWVLLIVGWAIAAWATNKLGHKWFTVYAAKFSNNGQTVYIPYIKAKEHHILIDLNDAMKKLR